MHYIQNHEVAYRSIDGEAVLVIPHTSDVKVLNEVGTRIWEALEGPRSIDEIVSVVVAEFEITEEQARIDALTFIEALVSRDLVHQVT